MKNVHDTAPAANSQDDSEQGHDTNKVYKIMVNGRPKEVHSKVLTFVDVAKLAFDDAVFNDVTVYTITYKRGEGNKPEGTLVEGESVKVKEGMVFNVKRTDKS
ncbi:MAG: hypothetical protein EPN62_03350 [Candidimonas sp.]|nr:MAG: hypothetical protein EPN62_03350 [Candidimonas sp.]